MPPSPCYEPGTSQVRRLFANQACWFEPIENTVQAAQRAREGLIPRGDLTSAGYTYHPTMYYLLECAPTLDVFIAKVEEGLAFARRTGNEQVSQHLDSCRWLAGVLRGESSAAAGAADSADSQTDNPVAHLAGHVTGGIAAAIFDDQAALARHTAAATPLLAAVGGFYPIAAARLLRGLALAGQARAADGEERAGLLAELEEVTRWLLGAMTGATSVHLALWHPGRPDWLLPAPGSSGGTVPADGVGREDAVPVSVLRYVQRTGEPLVVADAVADDRFARDPYFAGAGCCALLAVPVVSRGALRAVLVLENRLLRAAFTADRLDPVQPTAACGPPSRPSPAAPRSRSTCRCMPTGGCLSRSRSAHTTWSPRR